MKSHGKEFLGPMIVEIVDTLPAWSSDDIGRFVYASDTNKMYYGNSSEWVEF